MNLLAWRFREIIINSGGYFYGKTKENGTGTKSIHQQFIGALSPNDARDVQEMLKDLLGDTLQGMLEAEMNETLGYSRYDNQGYFIPS